MASDLGLTLHCLPMSHKKEASLIWVNIVFTVKFWTANQRAEVNILALSFRTSLYDHLMGLL